MDATSRLHASSKQLREALVAKLGKSKAPATVSDITRLYVHSMLTIDAIVALAEIEGSDEHEAKMAGLETLKETMSEMAENFAIAVKGLTETQKTHQAKRKKPEAPNAV